MKKNIMPPIVIDLQRVPTGFKVKDEETVFVLKKTAQHPELNIQRKNPEFHINIPPKIIIPLTAFVTDINGVCNAGLTFQITCQPIKQANTKTVKCDKNVSGANVPMPRSAKIPTATKIKLPIPLAFF